MGRILRSGAEEVDFCVGEDKTGENSSQIACDMFADMRMFPTKLIEPFDQQFQADYLGVGPDIGGAAFIHWWSRSKRKN
jgi:hypothetical protein